VAQLGDVAERTQWVIKRGVRSGSGQNLVSVSEQQTLGTATGDVAERTQRVMKRGVRSGSGQNLVSVSEQQILGTATGRALLRDVPERTQYKISNKIQFNIEVWLSLVERYVRVSITTLGVEFSRRAENP